MIQYHLIKRNPELSATKNKKRADGQRWLLQKRFNGLPSGSKVKKDDIVYMYEKNYAVWGWGPVEKVKRYKKIETIDQLLEHISDFSEYKNNFFWGNFLLSEAWEKLRKGNNYLEIIEIRINIEFVDEPFALPKKFNSQQSWQYLGDTDILPEKEKIELSTKIPASLRTILYQEFNWEYKNYCIDIDHVVPSIVGGPGNIKENLMPVGATINRYKGGKVPAAFFYVAKSYDLYSKELPTSEKGLLSEKKWRDEAKIITNIINKDTARAKKFYNDVKERFLGKSNLMLADEKKSAASG